MNIIFVVSQQQDWPFDVPGITAITAHSYLMEPAYGDLHATKVFNLCRNYRYQNYGYYVSLLAEARGHQPLPDVEAIRGLQAADLLQQVQSRLENLIQCAFFQTEENEVHLDIYFGREPGGRHEHVCAQLFRMLRAPILHVRFERGKEGWKAARLHAGNISDIPEQHRPFLVNAVTDYLQAERIRISRPPQEQPTLAILHDPQRTEAPSNREAMQKFIEAASLLGMKASLITPRDAKRLSQFEGQFDALFMRATTNVNHYTYQLSRQAAAAGMVVIDDPDSILRCTNKIYLAELLTRHHVPVPRTLVVHNGNVDQIVPTLGLPCILKLPDGAFSIGVEKIHSEEELQARVAALLKESELILAQEYLPTDFDWRIAVLDRRPLFACKYYMAPGHWQVIKHERHKVSEGRTEALAVSEVPDEVLEIAVRAANLIGDGFYGVDMKQVGGQYYVIEINDNPSVDAGNEDGVLGDALYREVMGVFRKRIDALKGNTAL
jgi:glutathione synthase/RimK-type ligase-like ATP-grasp enzyme